MKSAPYLMSLIAIAYVCSIPFGLQATTNPVFKNSRLEYRPSYLTSRTNIPPPVSGSRIAAPSRPSHDDVRDEGNPLESEINIVRKARETIAEVKKAGRFLEKLTAGDLVALPVGVQKKIGNITYTLGIESIRLYPTYTEAAVFMEVDLPDTEQDPVFGASGVRFSRSGGFSGDLQLQLLSDFPIDIRDGKSRIVLEKSDQEQEEGTYATVNCNGFRSLGIKGYIVFSRDWLIPINNNGRSSATGRVKGHFNFQADSWDIVASVSDFTPFVIHGFEDLQWRVDGISLDFSDIRNPEQLSLPPGYPSPFQSEAGLSPLWKGVYVEGFSVTLPQKFSPEGGSPTAVEARNMIIDDQGLTGQLSAFNLLSLEQGNMDGWAFSLDTLAIRLMAMQFEELRFAGKINLPLFGGRNSDPINPSDCLDYTAMLLTGNDYRFSVNAGADRYADIWKARVRIEPNSTLALQYTDGQFNASATLYGSVSIDDRFGTEIDFNLPETRFENLQLSNRAPYFHPGYWQIPENLNARFGPFEMGLEEIGLQEGDQPMTSALRVTALIGLAADNIDLTALGGFRIGGKLVLSGQRQRWVYESFQVDSILVAASTESWGIGGRLDFFKNDPRFGSGFYGRGELWFSALGGTERGLSAAVQFGAKPGTSGPFRYFFCDVMARPDVTILAGLQLKGIGGGVFYRMDRAGGPEVISNQSQCDWTAGSSLSGITYLPDETKGITAKANIVIAATGKDVWSVNGAFEISFYAGGGLDYVSIHGNAVAFGPVNWDNSLQQASASGVTILVNMYYHQSPEFRGFRATADVFLNVKNRFTGISAHPHGLPNYAGGLDLEFSSQTWYINIGTPEIPLAAGLKVPVLGQLAVSSYLDIGNHIPPMPDLPEYIQSLTGAGNFMRNESLTAAGAGFAFGAALDLNTGKRKVLGTFYYELAIGLGFDMMLQNYGEAVCADSQEKIGINGWYASGQAWAFFEGEIGVNVNLGFIKGEFPILHAAAAVALQAKGPDPFWARGTVGGKYNVLNGLVKGSFRIGVTIGNECIITEEGSDPFANLDLITGLAPNDGTSGISTEARPSAVFALPAGQPFSVDEATYQLTVASSLSIAGQPLNAALLYEPGDVVAESCPDELLPGNADIRFEVTAYLVKKSPGCSGYCDTVKTETKAVTFTTSADLEFIPASNVRSAYPFNGQYNFYPEEFPSGYIYLKTGQANLFYNLPGGQVQKVRFTDGSGNSTECNLVYHPESRKITFPLPPSGLEEERLYKLEVINRHETPPQAMTASLSSGEEQPDPGQEPSSAEESVSVLYTAFFRTSRFGRFEEKIQAISELTLNEGVGLLSLQKPMKALFVMEEPFEQAELYGSAGDDPLMEWECRAEIPWFQGLGFQNLIYDHFPVNNGVFQIPNNWRDLTLGNVPTGAVGLRQETEGLVVSESNYLQNHIPNPSPLPDTLIYAFPNLVITDYMNYKSAVDSMFLNWATQSMAESGELGPEELERLDRNADGVVSAQEWIQHFRESCTVECTDCFPGGAGFQCPIPPFLAELNEAGPVSMDSVRGKTFEVIVRYKLPGAGQVTTSKTLRLTKD